HLLIHIQAADFGKTALELVENQEQIRSAENCLLNGTQALLSGACDEVLHEILRDAAGLDQNQAFGNVHLGQEVREQNESERQTDERYQNPPLLADEKRQKVAGAIQSKFFHRANLHNAGAANLSEAKTRLSSNPRTTS